MPKSVSVAQLSDQVVSTEAAFARTMADRDFAGFLTFLAEEAVFFNGETPLRGMEAVARQWQQYYVAPQAPFSWAPGQVVVLATGDLALSSGLVRDPGGAVIGTFNSIWRRTADGDWKVVFDKGGPPPAQP